MHEASLQRLQKYKTFFSLSHQIMIYSSCTCLSVRLIRCQKWKITLLGNCGRGVVMLATLLVFWCGIMPKRCLVGSFMMGVVMVNKTGELIGNLSFSTLQILVRELISLYRIQDWLFWLFGIFRKLIFVFLKVESIINALLVCYLPHVDVVF